MTAGSRLHITLFGGTGQVGSRVLAEAVSRGHHVTAVVRDPSRALELPPAVHAEIGDATNVTDVSRLSAGQDLVISATRPGPGREPELVIAAKALLAGLAGTGVRLLLVGGAAGLTVPGGTTVLNDPRFSNESYRAIAEACIEQFEVCRADTEVDWTYASPPALLVPGKRTGNYRVGSDELVVDSEGRSMISYDDFAVALIDEAERPVHKRTRFTVAY